MVALSHRVGLVGLGLVLVVGALAGCRGSKSTKPPVHIVQNMDQQNRFEGQEENPFFADGRAMRDWPEGTVAWGALHEDDHLWRGKDEAGEWAASLPDKDDKGVEIKPERALLERGQERYEIFCVPCHDYAGTGKGQVVQRGFMPPPTFHEGRVKEMAVGQIYDVITSGARNMASYRSQLGLRDRWAVAAYVAALQLARGATLRQVPPDRAATERWEVP